MRQESQVRRVDAAADPAEMVELESRWNGADKKLKGDLMRAALRPDRSRY